jgi:hypothetical protein
MERCWEKNDIAPLYKKVITLAVVTVEAEIFSQLHEKLYLIFFSQSQFRT